MKKALQHAVSLFLALLLAAMLCGSTLASGGTSGDIIILYTNDVHCGIDENIGYAGLSAYRSSCLEKTPYVTLVDCGDAIQGDVIGTVSSGEYLIDIMNQVGYDFAVLGNHEFYYGLEQLSELLGKADARYLDGDLGGYAAVDSRITVR